ncbi:hypothetical protein HYH03_012642 [Edaphochlamys debaryana]|uniref:Uncharacterized protein n=1 Tax=Edaphochlamys debaryana TaxID=47281 RepID=A0A836BTY7_9CHLO|nr:hypothetical protein HYH03_012642 [Edaphochlamys debaryana]|eukprot:KAG2488845.1 hypothetical protein HYH03_012642 [Edaphochlamys debaryana]
MLSALTGRTMRCKLVDPLTGASIGSGGTWVNAIAIDASTPRLASASAVEYLSCDAAAKATALLAIDVAGSSRALAVSIRVPGGGMLRLVSFNTLQVAPGSVAALLTQGVNTACRHPPSPPSPPSPPPPMVPAPPLVPVEWEAYTFCAACLISAVTSGSQRRALQGTAYASAAAAAADASVYEFVRGVVGGLDTTSPVRAIPPDSDLLVLSDEALAAVLEDASASAILSRRLRRASQADTVTAVFLTSGRAASGGGGGADGAGSAATLLQRLAGNNSAARCALIDTNTGNVIGTRSPPAWGASAVEIPHLQDVPAAVRPPRDGSAMEAISCAPGAVQQVARVIGDYKTRSLPQQPLVVDIRPYANGGVLRLIPATLAALHADSVAAALLKGLPDTFGSACPSSPPPVKAKATQPKKPRAPPPQAPARAPPSPPPPALPPPPPPLGTASSVEYGTSACLSRVVAGDDTESQVLLAFLDKYFPASPSSALPASPGPLLVTDSALLLMRSASSQRQFRDLAAWTAQPGVTVTVLLWPDVQSSVTLLSALNGARLRCGLVHPEDGSLVQPGTRFTSTVDVTAAQVVEGVGSVLGIACAAGLAKATVVAAGTGVPLIVHLPLANGNMLRLAAASLAAVAPAVLAADMVTDSSSCEPILVPVLSPPPKRAARQPRSPPPAQQQSCVSVSDAGGAGTVVVLPKRDKDDLSQALRAFLPQGLPSASVITSIVDLPTVDSRSLVMTADLLLQLNAKGQKVVADFAATAGQAVTLLFGKPGSVNSDDVDLSAALDILQLGSAASCTVANRSADDGSVLLINCQLPTALSVNCAREKELAAVVPIATAAGAGRVRIVAAGSLLQSIQSIGDEGALSGDAVGAMLSGYVAGVGARSTVGTRSAELPTDPAWKVDACRSVFGPCVDEPDDSPPYIVSEGATYRQSTVDGWHEVVLGIQPLADTLNTSAAYSIMFLTNPVCEGSLLTAGLLLPDEFVSVQIRARPWDFRTEEDRLAAPTNCSAVAVPGIVLTPELAAKPGLKLLLRFSLASACSSLADLCGDYMDG